jgi:hypothetical protein
VPSATVSSATCEISGRRRRAAAVRRLLAEQDEVGRFALDRRSERSARRHEVGARGRFVGNEQNAVGAHGQRLPQRLERPLRAERDEHDLRRGVVALDPQRLLDCIRVERVQRRFARPVEPLAPRVDPPGVLGHRFRADDDLHSGAGLYPGSGSSSECLTHVTRAC